MVLCFLLSIHQPPSHHHDRNANLVPYSLVESVERLHLQRSLFHIASFLTCCFLENEHDPMTSSKRLGRWFRHRRLMFVATAFGALVLGQQLYQLPESEPVVPETEWNTTLWLPPSAKSKSATNQMAINHWDYKTSTIDFTMAPGTHLGTTTNPHSSSPFRNLTLPLCLVHIGKSAGSSVSCGLGFTYANCEGMPRNRIPNTHFFHMRRKNCPVDNTATLLVTLRNPIDRK
jgi:hypothetical protein